MCTTCGCGSAEHDHGEHLHDGAHPHDHAHPHPDHPDGEHSHAARTVRIERELLEKNTRLAAANRRKATRDGVTILNVIGSPGAGKTSLLEAVLPHLSMPSFVLEGDQATDRDAKRIEAIGCRAVQINTGTGCHLDASMIDRGVSALTPPRGSVVVVENVGNLVCPALFDLGEKAKIVVMSVTEGDDKPLKYPHVFRAARLLVLTKIDLARHVDFDDARLVGNVRQVTGPGFVVLRTSARTREGIDALAAWIQAEVAHAPRGAVGAVST